MGHQDQKAQKEVEPEKIAFMTKQELAVWYGVSPKTIQKYCGMINIETNGMRLSPKQVRKFVEHFGRP
jgi:hypothetical protein